MRFHRRTILPVLLCAGVLPARSFYLKDGQRVGHKRNPLPADFDAALAKALTLESMAREQGNKYAHSPE